MRIATLPCCLAGASGPSHQRLSCGSRQGVYSFTGHDCHRSTSRWGYWLNLLMACLEGAPGWGGEGVVPKLYPCSFHARPDLFHIIPRNRTWNGFLIPRFHEFIPRSRTWTTNFKLYILCQLPRAGNRWPRRQSWFHGPKQHRSSSLFNNLEPALGGRGGNQVFTAKQDGPVGFSASTRSNWTAIGSTLDSTPSQWHIWT